jgi:signal transduction histidine kinase
MTPPEPIPSHGPSDQEQSAAERRRRPKGLTIRLKLTLWYGGLFLLAGVLLIAINFFMVRGSLTPAPEKARAAVAEQFGIPPESLEFTRGPGPGSAQIERHVTINGIPLPLLLDEAQKELKAEALRQLWSRSLIALAIITVVTFGLAWLLAGRMLRPLHTISSTAQKLSVSTLHERIALPGPKDELKDLADTFDAMLGRLDRAFTAQRDFVANASHELRTPLTIVRTEIDVALNDPDITADELRDMGEAVREAVDRSERLIEGLLMLARTESHLQLTAVDLAAIARSQADVMVPQATDLDLRWELHLSPAPLSGDRVLLERLVGNLVENAVRHNRPGGWIVLATTSLGQGYVELRVTNSGPVVAPDILERLFDRFYRPDLSRSRKTGGFGLGLSIVKSVADAHGGTVRLAAPPAGGLEVTVTLPTDPATPPSPSGAPTVS